MNMFQMGSDRYQTDPDGFAGINQRELVMIVGLVALGLPIMLFLASHNPIYSTCFRHSISHFYYAPFWGTAFTGALFFIGTYLLIWQGEAVGSADGKLATRAGLAAYGVALFPTGGWGCDDPTFSARPMTGFGLPDGSDFPALIPPNGTPAEVANAYFMLEFPISGLSWFKAEWIHYLSALTMFAFLAWFSLYVFTRVEDRHKKSKGGLTARKATRNSIYILSGLIIVVSILALIGSFIISAFFPSIDFAWWDAGNWTFWFEAFALWAFGFSWMVKGQFFRFLADPPQSAKPPEDPPAPEPEPEALEDTVQPNLS
jgi:hypothetical protein